MYVRKLVKIKTLNDLGFFKKIKKKECFFFRPNDSRRHIDLEERKQRIENYLRELEADEVIRQSKEFRIFIGLSKDLENLNSNDDTNKSRHSCKIPSHIERRIYFNNYYLIKQNF